MRTYTEPGGRRCEWTPKRSERPAGRPLPGTARLGVAPNPISVLLLTSLGQPAAYPGDASAASGIEHVQTHLSHLFLTRDRAYKLRKAVDLGFVDFTTRSERNADCIREVRLNRRLAPDVYLGVAPLERGPGGFVVGELFAEPPVALSDAAEHCVVMRRLPAGRDALNLLSAGILTRRHIDAAADRIAAFHRENRLPRQQLRGDHEILQSVMQPFDDCIRTLQATLPSPGIATTLSAIQRLARAFLEERGEEVCEYVRRGSQIDGHGDIHLQHLWFEQGRDFPLIIDCLEFSRALRRTNAASEIAFLAMDLAYRGHDGLAESLLSRYADTADEFELYRVVDFYESYRAVVRAKVAAIASTDATLGREQRCAARESAHRHLAFAARALRKRSRGSMILLCGKVGTGKSTVADCLAHLSGGIVVSSDRLRRKLSGLPPGDHVAVPTDTGLYSPRQRAAIYQAMLERTAPVVASGRLAILDASFHTAALRNRARDWARGRGVPVLLVEVDCEEETALGRLSKRQVAGTSASDAGPEFYATSAARFEPPDEWPRGIRVRVRTDAATWRADLCCKLRSWRKQCC